MFALQDLNRGQHIPKCELQSSLVFLGVKVFFGGIGIRLQTVAIAMRILGFETIVAHG